MNNKEVAMKICDRILDLVQASGKLPWSKPWSNGQKTIRVVDGYTEITLQPSAWNRAGKFYQGINTYLPVGEYITFNQCKKEGGHIRKGAKGWPICYWQFIHKKVKDEATGEVTEEVIPMLKYYTVFNVEHDCEGLVRKHTPETRTYRIENVKFLPVDAGELPMSDAAEAVIAGYVNRAGNGFKLNRDAVSDRAYYSPSGDYVTVPCRQQYDEMGEYYSTIFHELAHSTGHETRLNRFTGKAKNAAFGTEEYSKEELVAEISSASVLNAIGLESANTFRNSAAYVQSWSRKIKDDPMCYVSAANKAQAAFNLILGIKDGDESNAEIV